MNPNHRIRTTHIQHLLEEALDLARAVDNRGPHFSIQTLPDDDFLYAFDALSRITNLATHAAAEIEDERQQCIGWVSV